MIQKKTNKLALASILGTALEYYDFTLFGILSPIISTTFFPSINPSSSLLWCLTVFAAGFLMRPIGAIFFGNLGDKYGRKNALSWSIIFIAFPTLIIGILPSYETIGEISTIIIVICRLIQGFCVGGENNGAAIFLIEHAEDNKKGFAGSLVIEGVYIGIFLATIISYIVSSSFMPTWGWRLAFILGFPAGMIGLYIRRKIEESPDFKQISRKNLSHYFPLKDVILSYPLAFVCAICLGGATGVLGYTLAVYSNVFLNTVVKTNLQYSLLMNIVALLTAIVTGFITGVYSSNKQTAIKIILSGFWLSAILAFPIYFLLSYGSYGSIFAAEVLIGFSAGYFTAPVHSFLYYIFPTKCRYTGSAVGFSIGMCLFGGTTPIISSILINSFNNKYAPAIYLLLVSLLCLGIVSFYLRIGRKLFIWSSTN